MTDDPDTTPSSRILRAIRFHDRVFAVDLFDAMGVTDGERVAFAAAMARLVKTGKIRRYGKRPFEYGPVKG